MRQKPEDAIAHFNLGNSLYAKHDVNGAISEYRKALKIKAEYPEAHRSLADALYAKHDINSTKNAALRGSDLARIIRRGGPLPKV